MDPSVRASRTLRAQDAIAAAMAQSSRDEEIRRLAHENTVLRYGGGGDSLTPPPYYGGARPGQDPNAVIDQLRAEFDALRREASMRPNYSADARIRELEDKLEFAYRDLDMMARRGPPGAYVPPPPPPIHHGEFTPRGSRRPSSRRSARGRSSRDDPRDRPLLHELDDLEHENYQLRHDLQSLLRRYEEEVGDLIDAQAKGGKTAAQNAEYEKLSHKVRVLQAKARKRQHESHMRKAELDEFQRSLYRESKERRKLEIEQEMLARETERLRRANRDLVETLEMAAHEPPPRMLPPPPPMMMAPPPPPRMAPPPPPPIVYAPPPPPPPVYLPPPPPPVYIAEPITVVQPPVQQPPVVQYVYEDVPAPAPVSAEPEVIYEYVNAPPVLAAPPPQPMFRGPPPPRPQWGGPTPFRPGYIVVRQYHDDDD